MLMASAISLGRAQLGELTISGIRPGMSRTQVERFLPVRLDRQGLTSSYQWPHPGRGCHCECPRVDVEYSSSDIVLAVTGPVLERGGWPLAGRWESAEWLQSALGSRSRQVELNFSWHNGWKLESARLGPGPLKADSD